MSDNLQSIGWLQFFIAALDCYRLTIFVTRDYGPWGVFSRFRKIDRCSKLLRCVFCVSVYMGAFVCVGFLWASPIVRFISVALALSSVTIILDRVFTADYRSD